MTTNGTLAFYNRSTTQMSAIRQEAEILQSRLATGSRIDRSSQDPVASSRLRVLERTSQLAAIDATNAARASDGLFAAAGALASIAQDVARTRELALWAANDTLSAEARASLGQEIEQLRINVLANANTRDGRGQPLFSGELDVQPYALDAAGNASYVGTFASGNIALGAGQSVVRGVTGPEFLSFESNGNPTDLLAAMKRLADALQSGSPDPNAAAVTGLAELDDALEAVTRSQTVIGTRLAWIETVQDRHVVQSERRAGEQAEVGGVDLATTIAQLQQKLTILEASQAGFARLSALSLFDVL